MERETEAYESSPETEGVLGAATPRGRRRQGERAFHDMQVRCNVEAGKTHPVKELSSGHP